MTFKLVGHNLLRNKLSGIEHNEDFFKVFDPIPTIIFTEF